MYTPSYDLRLNKIRMRKLTELRKTSFSFDFGLFNECLTDLSLAFIEIVKNNIFYQLTPDYLLAIHWL